MGPASYTRDRWTDTALLEPCLGAEQKVSENLLRGLLILDDAETENPATWILK
jgi:hypothetical protein